ncbi:MAG: flagellar hook capping FlgD N-terminal domain-containing protein [Edaphobacter sp.]
MDLSQLNSIATSEVSGTSAANTVANALSSRRAVQATPKDSTIPTNSPSSSASDSSNITSDDFLTLLVSELKNQDPTQPTDPNQYITQLAQVNSLQQLISINKGIGALDSVASGTGTPHSSAGSNTNVNAVAAAVDSNTGVDAPSASGQNAIWGGSAS